MLTLLRHADLYAPHAVGLRDLLIGGGQVLAIGKNLPALGGAEAVEEVDLEGRPRRARVSRLPRPRDGRRRRGRLRLAGPTAGAQPLRAQASRAAWAFLGRTAAPARCASW